MQLEPDIDMNAVNLTCASAQRMAADWRKVTAFVGQPGKRNGEVFK
jgi:hypothetical protein